MRKVIGWIIEAVVVIWIYLGDGLASPNDDEAIVGFIGRCLMVTIGVTLTLLVVVQTCKFMGIWTFG